MIIFLQTTGPVSAGATPLASSPPLPLLPLLLPNRTQRSRPLRLRTLRREDRLSRPTAGSPTRAWSGAHSRSARGCRPDSASRPGRALSSGSSLATRSRYPSTFTMHLEVRKCIRSNGCTMPAPLAVMRFCGVHTSSATACRCLSWSARASLQHGLRAHLHKHCSRRTPPHSSTEFVLFLVCLFCDLPDFRGSYLSTFLYLSFYLI